MKPEKPIINLAADAPVAAGSPARRLPGGSYRPLSGPDMERIHATALDVLEKIGLAEPTEELLEYALPQGCRLADNGRLLFPRSLVEDAVAAAPGEYTAYGVDRCYDIRVGGQQVYTCTSGESVSILDYESQRYRPSTLIDLYDAARLADRLENIHSFAQPFIASEYSDDLYLHDINAAYAQLAGTRKNFGLGTARAEHIDPIISLFDLHLGREGAFLERPFCSFGGCPILSPLTFSRHNLEVLIKMARLGLPGDVAIAAQTGTTAPAALAGTLVQTFAETLACLCVVHLVRPGSPFNFGMWPFVSDLRTGAFSGGGSEQALVTAATAQLCNHYGLITSVPSGMTDAKTMDAQAGHEKALSTAAAALAGGNLISAFPGIVGSLMAQSFEGMVIDNDLLGGVLRMVRGVEVTDDTLSYEVIATVVAGEGHFLGHDQTLALMKSEYVYPSLSDRRTPEAWQRDGSPTIYETAHARVQRMLGEHYPTYIDPQVDQRIRSRFPIRLDPGAMRPGNGRW